MGPLDLQTGTLRFERTPLEIGASLTRTAFLNSPVGAKAGIVVKNEPWCSWKFRVVDQGEPFGVVLYFLEEQLKTAHLVAAHARFGVTWEDVTRDTLNAQMAFHAHWLRERCGVQELSHPWGRLFSTYDSKGCFAFICFEYGPGRGGGWVYTSVEELETAVRGTDPKGWIYTKWGADLVLLVPWAIVSALIILAIWLAVAK